MAEAIAQRVAPRVRRSQRTLDERAIVRFPRVYGALAALLVSALGPRSRLRQYALARLVGSSLSAVARGDIELWLASYARDAVHEWSPGFVSLGLPERANGAHEMGKAMSEWVAGWEQWSMTPRYIVDLGDSMIVLAVIAGRSLRGGVDVDIEHTGVIDISKGLARHERDFNNWSEGLSACGIDPAVLSRFEHLKPGQTLDLPV